MVRELEADYVITRQDIDFWYDGPVPRLQFKRDLARHNRGLYTENFEAVNAVTWRCPATKTIVSIDIVGSDVVRTTFFCLSMLLVLDKGLS